MPEEINPLRIHIRKEDLIQQPYIKDGWNEFEAKSVVVQPTKAGDSINYVTRFELVENPNKYIDHRFNSKPMGQKSLMICMAAMDGKPLGEVLNGLPADIDLDLNKLIGKHVMGKVAQVPGNDGTGRLYTNITDFAPVNKVPF